MWISVKNGLPEADDRIIACSGWAGEKTAIEILYYDGTRKEFHHTGIRWDHVTHWQPLPSPPEGWGNDR